MSTLGLLVCFLMSPFSGDLCSHGDESFWNKEDSLQNYLLRLEIKYIICGGHEPATKYMRFDKLKIDFSGLSEKGHVEFCVNWRKESND